jgi:hypothetical protein
MPTFKDWKSRMDAIQATVKECLNPEMKVKFLIPSGEEGELLFSFNNMVITIDGQPTHISNAQSVYQAYSSSIEGATVVAKLSAVELLKASDQVLLALTENAVPAMVMNRMSGNGTPCEPRAFLKASVDQKVKELINEIKLKFPNWCSGIDVEIMPDLKLSKSSTSRIIDYSIVWKDVYMNGAGAADISAMDCILFLSEYQHIQKKCLDFCDVFANTRMVTNW